MGLEEPTPSSRILLCTVVSVSLPWVMQSSRHKYSRISGLSKTHFKRLVLGSCKEGQGEQVDELPGVVQLLSWILKVTGVVICGCDPEPASS